MSYARAFVFALVMLGAAIGSAQTVIRVAPPAPVQSGVVGVAPRPGYVWIGGYQHWNGTRYVWVSGRWGRPPRFGAVWVTPRYVRRGNTWVFYKGYWR